MSQSAEAVSANLTSWRNITIEITNLSRNYCLADPRVYLESGSCHIPPQPTVWPLKTEVCNFAKHCGKATGTVGVLTYDLFDMQSNCAREAVAVMFSVPFDYKLYKNWLAVGIYHQGRECNKSLYEEMYYNNEQKSFVREEAKGDGLMFEGTDLDVRATMSPMGRAIMKVEVWDKFFTHQMQHPC